MHNPDRKTFVADLAAQHGQRLRRFLTRRLHNRADAPDLVQEVYLRLLRMERHEGIRSPEAYLLTVASHLLREHAVRQSVAPTAVELDEMAAELRTGADADPAAGADRDQRLRELEKAMSRLSAKATAVLLLHRRDGYSLDEIAAQLGISRSMVKKYLSQALSQCRQRLERLERE